MEHNQLIVTDCVPKMAEESLTQLITNRSSYTTPIPRSKTSQPGAMQTRSKFRSRDALAPPKRIDPGYGSIEDSGFEQSSSFNSNTEKRDSVCDSLNNHLDKLHLQSRTEESHSSGYYSYQSDREHLSGSSTSRHRHHFNRRLSSHRQDSTDSQHQREDSLGFHSQSFSECDSNCDSNDSQWKEVVRSQAENPRNMFKQNNEGDT